jgi:glycosyltransferase involved in cell wall biosynthesis
MPTVDSAPQKTEWVDTFRKADGVLTYSEWGQEVLREHGNGTINLHGCASPGVDLEVFKPVADKQAHKERMGFLPDTNIIGTVMRNQKRKLLPDLFESFRLFLDNAKKDVADKTYLYLHTSYPDRGWDIPYLLNKFDLGNKVLFTYICTETKKPFYTFFQDGRTYSPYSGQATGTLPNVKAGLTQEQLAEVYNLFDVYVQYAICEGFGMPQVEAAACGVPVMAVDYSAMRSVVRNLGGTPLKVGRMFNEMETGAMRAYPDNAFLSRTLDRCFSSSRKERQANEIKARKKAVKRYGWDGTAKAWEDYFDSVVLKGHQGKWDEVGYRHLSPATQEPTDLTNKEFIDWIYNHVIIAPDDKFTLEAAQVLRDLNLGVVYNKGNFMTINRERIYETFKTVALNKTKVEQVRCGRQELAMPDFVRFADNKGQSV